jgi:hypothetical protein
MGFEHFRVELRGGRATHLEAEETIRQIPHVQLDHDSVPVPGSTYYVLADGTHVIEIELMDSPVRLSCRFTLCHPASVDVAFLSLVRELMIRLGMEVKICDDFSPEPSGPFSVDEFAEFVIFTTGCIAARRAEWTAAFGNQTIAATTNEVYQRVILPRCQPGIEQPT